MKNKIKKQNDKSNISVNGFDFKGSFADTVKNDVKKATQSSPFTFGLIKNAIRDAIQKALQSSQVVANVGNNKFYLYQIDGELYDLETATNKLLNQYSWWNE